MGSEVIAVDLERLRRAMARETDLLHRFEQGQEELLRGVRDRSWSTLERRLDQLRALSQEIEQAEKERVVAAGAAPGNSPSFASSIARLPVSDQVGLERGYHELNLAVAGVKGSLSRLDHYVGAVMGTLNTMLGELLPHRKGRIYSATGDERKATGEAIVLDRHQ